MKIKFMSWNTRLYMQGNNINKKQEDINIEQALAIFEIIKKNVDTKDGVGVAILQEVPYKLNECYRKGSYDLKKWESHPVFEKLIEYFSTEMYDVLYDDSKEWRIIQTVVIAQKGKVCPSKHTSSNSFYSFKIDDLQCLAVHANNAYELREWLKVNDVYPRLMAGDFNAGNYLLSDRNKDIRIVANRQNYLLLTEGYIDLFQGVYTTNYSRGVEQRQIDHVLIENSCDIWDKYYYEGVEVDRSVCISDHFPLYWTLVKKTMG